MIELTTGNLLETNTEALVNTVNCVGVMGKGIALQFKQAYPDNFRAYEQACRAGEVQLGRMLTFSTGTLVNPKYIINFPTKRHWKGKSRIEDINRGLIALIDEVQRLEITSIAVPPLGCGNGGLNWSDVRPLIEAAFASLPHVRVLLYAPIGAPDAEAMPVRTTKPRVTQIGCAENSMEGQPMRERRSMTPARQDTIIAALERVGATQPCERCGHPTLEVCGESGLPLLSSQRNASIPTVVLACQRCGFIVEHAAMVLGLV